MIYRCQHGLAVDLVASIVTGSATWNTSVVMNGRAIDTGGQASLFVVLGYAGGTTCWFAGIDITGELSGAGPRQVIGRFVSGSPRVVAYDALPVAEKGRTYRIQVDVAVVGSAAQITLTVDDNEPVILGVATSSLYNGSVGAGGFGCDIDVLQFGIGSCGI